MILFVCVSVHMCDSLCDSVCVCVCVCVCACGVDKLSHLVECVLINPGRVLIQEMGTD